LESFVLVAASLLSGIQFFSGHAAMGTQQFGDGLEWGGILVTGDGEFPRIQGIRGSKGLRTAR